MRLNIYKLAKVTISSALVLAGYLNLPAQIPDFYEADGLKYELRDFEDTFIQFKLVGPTTFNSEILELPDFLMAKGFSWWSSEDEREGIIEEINENAFYHSNLTSVVLPKGLKHIGKNAFAVSKHLGNIEIPEGVLTIGEGAFCECPLKEVEIPESVIFIGWQAFAGCSSLKRVTLPSTLSALGGRTFDGCFFLKDIYCYATIPPAAQNSDFGYLYHSEWYWPTSEPHGPLDAGCTIHVPEESIDLYKNAPGWNLFHKIVGISPTEVEELETLQSNDVNFLIEDDGVTLLGEEGDAFTICDESGIILDSGNFSTSGAYYHKGSGIRIIKVNDNSVKVII